MHSSRSWRKFYAAYKYPFRAGEGRPDQRASHISIPKDYMPEKCLPQAFCCCGSMRACKDDKLQNFAALRVVRVGGPHNSLGPTVSALLRAQSTSAAVPQRTGIRFFCWYLFFFVFFSKYPVIWLPSGLLWLLINWDVVETDSGWKLTCTADRYPLKWMQLAKHLLKLFKYIFSYIYNPISAKYPQLHGKQGSLSCAEI